MPSHVHVHEPGQVMPATLLGVHLEADHRLPPVTVLDRRGLEKAYALHAAAHTDAPRPPIHVRAAARVVNRWVARAEAKASAAETAAAEAYEMQVLRAREDNR